MESSILSWKIDAVQMVGLACAGIGLGEWLKRRIGLLRRLSIPVPIAGGMVFAVLAAALHGRLVNVEANTELRDLLMIAFMTTIGLSARLQLLRESSGRVVMLLGLASFGAILQNALGMGMAAAFGLDARVGILAGSVALTGGPATAVAFGSTFERMGVPAATEVGMASATFGITVAGLLGAYIGARLIRRYELSPTQVATPAAKKKLAIGGPAEWLRAVVAIGISMGLGNLLSGAIQRKGIILPAYIGAMIVAAVLRNLDDRWHFARLAQEDIDGIGRIVLYLFIVMALITLRLWELAALALPLVAILAAQVALCWLMCVAMSFPLMGRDYESAVTASGFCGFMLGITANAMACMEELVEAYGAAPRSFLIVPVVGAFLIDFTNSLIVTAMANVIR